MAVDILVDYAVFQTLTENHQKFLANKTTEEITKVICDFSYYFKQAHEEAVEDLDVVERQDFDSSEFLENWLNKKC